jgi:hypothetical protein
MRLRWTGGPAGRAGGDEMKTQTLHYAGPIRTTTTYILAGWAACCSGDRAVRIRAEGRNTYIPERVTCKACLRMMALDADRAARARAEGETDHADE